MYPKFKILYTDTVLHLRVLYRHTMVLDWTTANNNMAIINYRTIILQPTLKTYWQLSTKHLPLNIIIIFGLCLVFKCTDNKIQIINLNYKRKFKCMSGILF